MDDMMDLAPKSAQKNLIKGGDWKNIYVPELKPIAFYKSNHREKVYDLIEDNSEALEATSEAAIAQHIKDNNLELNMGVEMTIGEIDEDYTGVVEEESV